MVTPLPLLTLLQEAIICFLDKYDTLLWVFLIQHVLPFCDLF